MDDKSRTVTPDPWAELKSFTEARISLGRCGQSLPLSESLAFKLAHARARDAVWQPFDIDGVRRGIEDLGRPCLLMKSRAAHREEYLTRPDKGRRLSKESLRLAEGAPKGPDVCLVVGDGLSARAVHENAVPFLKCFLPILDMAGLDTAPVCLVENCRVALADEIAETMEASIVALLIGERPGLSSPNSMGVYLTYGARHGTTDEARNCISNIRPGGLPPADAAVKLAYLIEEALNIKATGIALKDKMPANYLPFGRPLPEISG